MTNCIACNTELQLVYDGFGDDSHQYDNTLEIHLAGGYGMFFDNLITGNYTVFLCHDCAHHACNQLPWLDKLINPLQSHSHREEYWQNNPDHQGWDRGQQ